MRSQAFSSPSKRGLVGLAVAGLVAALCLLLIPGAPDTASGQTEPTANAAKKKKKKKKDTVKVMTQNLYLGANLTPPVEAALIPRTDLFADRVGTVLSNVNANDFAVRARTIASGIKKQKVDVVGLQEAALWKLEIPTDGGGPPRGSAATVPLIDYIDTLLDQLNKKAKSKKQCAKINKKRKAQGKKKKKCYRGYYLVGSQDEADVEQFGDFDNNPGPNNRTCDISSGTCGNPYPSGGGGGGSDDWISGNDNNPGVNIGEPPPAQCADGIDNDGDGKIDFGFDWVAFHLGGGVGPPPQDEYSTPPPGAPIPPPSAFGQAAHCDSRLDNTETPDSAPLSLPQDANMDHHVYSPNFNAPSDPVVGAVPDKFGNGVDPAGVTDCPDTSPDPGPSVGATPAVNPAAPPWDAPGFDGDIDPNVEGSQVPVCMFHGIDGDIRLQMRDVIIARKGAGVKALDTYGGNFGNTFSVSAFGVPIQFKRGFIVADMSVRGKKFHLVNTHLESEDAGTIREDQALELVNPGGPAAAKKTVLLGDLNSDPDGGNPQAYNLLAANGFRSLTGPRLTSGHGELLNDLGNVLDNSRIDHILTNNSSITARSFVVLDPVGRGLWGSDHGGVLSRLAIPGGKKKGKKK